MDFQRTVSFFFVFKPLVLFFKINASLIFFPCQTLRSGYLNCAVHRELWSSHPRLTTLSATKHLHGVPINVPFTDLNELSMTLKSTHVHENEDENVRFALAVRVFAYPNRIFSVWVFAISITNM